MVQDWEQMHPAIKPVAIAKVPGQDNQYYVFTNTANGTTAGSISYRIVDMSLSGKCSRPDPSRGARHYGRQYSVAWTTTSEAMMVVAHPNGDDFWLITHVNGSARLCRTLFTPTGPTTTTTFTGLGLIEHAANFSYHPGPDTLLYHHRRYTRC